MLGLPGLSGRLGIQCLPATCSRKAPQNSISRNLRDVPVSTSCPLPVWLCTWGWGPCQGHRPARSCWLAPSRSCRASPFCYLNSPFFSLRQCGRPNGQLPRRAADRVAGVPAAAVRAPGHRRVRRGGRRGVPEAAGPQQAFLLSGRCSARGAGLGPRHQCELFTGIVKEKQDDLIS